MDFSLLWLSAVDPLPAAPETLLEIQQVGRQMRRGALLSAARKLLADRTFGDLRMRDVGRAAGMSEANVYNYFRNRTELCGCLVLDFFEDLVARLACSADRGLGLEHRLLQCADILGDAFHAAPHRHALIAFHEIHQTGKTSDFSPELSARIATAIRAMHEPLIRTVESYTFLGAREATDLVGHLVILANGVLLQAFKADGTRFSASELRHNIRLAVRGVVRLVPEFEVERDEGRVPLLS
ncbi:MAG: helix-turn-helix domain containing protein [Candidatus Binatia bacterium]|nr:helix-turn-helix domain containing protein [Candidatus Binatia bacterium]